jgi:ribosomal-protein-alanine N-acetyltransferase
MSGSEMPMDELQGHQIRRLDLTDLKIIMSISQKSLSEKYSKELMLELYNAWPDGFIVYSSNSKIYGFLVGKKMTQSEARILMLASDENYRSKGIGGELVEHFLITCQVYGIIVVRLEVRVDNKRGIKFYQTHGFMVTSILRNYYSDGTDAYVMWKQLV